MQTYGQWQFRADAAATAAAYTRAPQGDPERCGCSFCRNFIANRDTVLPSEFRSFLMSLGIDPSKAGEVYHEGRLGPGRHCYGGWFHFVGFLDTHGDFAPVEYENGFIACMAQRTAPGLAALDGLPLVQVEFRTQSVPWVISDEEPL
jgi:hypothetical protein